MFTFKAGLTLSVSRAIASLHHIGGFHRACTLQPIWGLNLPEIKWPGTNRGTGDRALIWHRGSAPERCWWRGPGEYLPLCAEGRGPVLFQSSGAGVEDPSLQTAAPCAAAFQASVQAASVPEPLSLTTFLCHCVFFAFFRP